VGVDPVELRENPRPSACKEKKTSFQIIKYLHFIEIDLIFGFFNLFPPVFAFFLREKSNVNLPFISIKENSKKQ
jgi:hypothetical protein